MTTRHVLAALALAGAFLAGTATATAAQVPLRDAEPEPAGPWHPEWGDRAIGFSLPAGGGAGFGYSRLRGPRFALGFTIAGLYDLVERDVPEGTDRMARLRLSGGPEIRRYWWTDGPVSPFLHAGLNGIYEQLASDVPAWHIGGEASLGLGVEWFPAQGIGIGGYTGASAGYTWVSDDDEFMDDIRRLSIRLLTSALTLRLYF